MQRIVDLIANVDKPYENKGRLMIDLRIATSQVEPHPSRGGLSVCLPDGENGASPIWTLGNFELQFVRMVAGETLELNADAVPTYVKVIVGELNCAPFRAFPKQGTVVSTRVSGRDVSAVEETLLCILRELESTPTITQMDQLRVSGPFSDELIWQSFHEKFQAFTDVFDGLEAHMVPGFHLMNSANQEVAYVHFWTTGKGADVSTHNHGQDPTAQSPAFAEVHLVLKNGTGAGAMYQCDAPGANNRTRTPIQLGEEHGPFFAVDPATRKPKLKPNGAVDYPWHGWQGGTDDQLGQSYDLVAAFEINPSFAIV